jgi:hypothetical protein
MLHFSKESARMNIVLTCAGAPVVFAAGLGGAAGGPPRRPVGAATMSYSYAEERRSTPHEAGPTGSAGASVVCGLLTRCD